jgi:hypothetical protein
MTNINSSLEFMSMINRHLVEKKLRKIEDLLRELRTVSIESFDEF